MSLRFNFLLLLCAKAVSWAPARELAALDAVVELLPVWLFTVTANSFGFNSPEGLLFTWCVISRVRPAASVPEPFHTAASSYFSQLKRYQNLAGIFWSTALVRAVIW